MTLLAGAIQTFLAHHLSRGSFASTRRAIPYRPEKRLSKMVFRMGHAHSFKNNWQRCALKSTAQSPHFRMCVWQQASAVSVESCHNMLERAALWATNCAHVDNNETQDLARVWRKAFPMRQYICSCAIAPPNVETEAFALLAANVPPQSFWDYQPQQIHPIEIVHEQQAMHQVAQAVSVVAQA
mmetsp:Transcript_39599/g.88697  ORF Transcript_39599/g.88697 Transcript_39599/m.88697 type:complete len:183 (-) Transcript_39599:774-1322(-)